MKPELSWDQGLILRELFEAVTSSPRQIGNRVVAVGRRLIECESMVLFQFAGLDASDYQPLAHDTPHAERLDARELTGYQEPMVPAVWASGRPALRHGSAGDTALFPGETAVAVVPVPGFGVLYAGADRDGEFSLPELQKLEFLGLQAGPALRSGLQFSEMNCRLEHHAGRHKKLQERVEGLVSLLEGLPGLASQFHPRRLIEDLGSRLDKLLPIEERFALLEGEGYWGGALEGARRGALRDLDRALLDGRRPLRFDQLKGSRFETLSPTQQSLLALPVLGEGGHLGVLALMSSKPSAFSEEHQLLGQLMASHFGVALQNAHLHRELLDSQAQLVQSSKLAAVGQLAAGVAHELNNPLAVVLLALEGWSKYEGRPELVRPLFQNARNAAVRARTIVEKLLNYSRDSGQGARRVELTVVVAEAIELIRHSLELDEIEVRLRQAREPIEARCNPNELQQVVINLLVNARDALLSDPLSLRQILLATRVEQGQAVLRIQDRGPGVPPDIRDRVFDPFFTTKPVGAGVGLGLSISHQICRRYGGSLELEETPGGGATFLVRLPLAVVED